MCRCIIKAHPAVCESRETWRRPHVRLRALVGPSLVDPWMAIRCVTGEASSSVLGARWSAAWRVDIATRHRLRASPPRDSPGSLGLSQIASTAPRPLVPLVPCPRPLDPSTPRPRDGSSVRVLVPYVSSCPGAPSVFNLAPSPSTAPLPPPPTPKTPQMPSTTPTPPLHCSLIVCPARKWRTCRAQNPAELPAVRSQCRSHLNVARAWRSLRIDSAERYIDRKSVGPERR